MAGGAVMWSAYCAAGRASDRDSGQSMHAKDHGEFAAMMEVVFDEMPNHKLAREGLLAWQGWGKDFFQIGDGPPMKRLINNLPSGFQTVDQFGSASQKPDRRRVVVNLAGRVCSATEAEHP